MGTHAKLTVKGRYAYITLSEEVERRPCTLDWVVIREMNQCCDEIEASIDELDAVVLESASPKSFVVGANIAALEELDPVNIMEWVQLGHDVFNRFSSFPVPTIAKVKYMALGGGLELAMACDFIIAGDQAKLGQPEASLGVMPGWGGSYRLATLAGPARAKELFMTAQPLTAKEAYEWGIVNHVCPSDEIDEYVERMLQQISKNDRKVLAYMKRFINDRFYAGMDHDAVFEAISSSVCLNSESTKERLNAFLHQEKNEFEGGIIK